MNTLIAPARSHPLVLASVLTIAGLGVPVATLNSAESKRPSTPVTIEGPVEVQGVVEVINDVLREPYVKTIHVPSDDSPTASFDIPDGKRLVIESIAFQASSPSGDSNRMFMHPLVSEFERQLVTLPIQFTSVEGPTSYHISLLPLKMRLDSIAGSVDELQIRRGSGGNGTLIASIFGYLVDIP